MSQRLMPPFGSQDHEAVAPVAAPQVQTEKEMNACSLLLELSSPSPPATLNNPQPNPIRLPPIASLFNSLAAPQSRHRKSYSDSSAFFKTLPTHQPVPFPQQPMPPTPFRETTLHRKTISMDSTASVSTPSTPHLVNPPFRSFDSSPQLQRPLHTTSTTTPPQHQHPHRFHLPPPNATLNPPSIYLQPPTDDPTATSRPDTPPSSTRYSIPLSTPHTTPPDHSTTTGGFSPLLLSTQKRFHHARTTSAPVVLPSTYHMQQMHHQQHPLASVHTPQQQGGMAGMHQYNKSIGTGLESVHLSGGGGEDSVSQHHHGRKGRGADDRDDQIARFREDQRHHRQSGGAVDRFAERDAQIARFREEQRMYQMQREERERGGGAGAMETGDGVGYERKVSPVTRVSPLVSGSGMSVDLPPLPAPAAEEEEREGGEEEEDQMRQLNASGNPVKKRLRANREQLKVLEAVFAKNRAPTPNCKKELAVKLGMPHKSILYWFQNRRAQLVRSQKGLAKESVGQSVGRSSGQNFEDIGVRSE
ncbi:hypothetical protein HDU98_006227 [Podochytrium sp. JEL0797]|nr:hypothetical protein HDU98_006227 [Podochytrium sp. JEL0797]